MCFRDQIQSSLIATCQRVSCLRRVSSLFARAVAGHLPESSPKNSKSWHAQEKFYEVLGHKPEGFRQRSTVFFMFFYRFSFSRQHGVPSKRAPCRLPCVDLYGEHSASVVELSLQLLGCLLCFLSLGFGFFLLILVLFFVNASRFWLKSEQPNNLKF